MPSAIEGRIWVVGVPRSGTTLVQSLLASHSQVTSFTESHFFSRHFRLLPGVSTPILVRDPGPRLREFLTENAAGDQETALLGPTATEVALRAPFLPWQTRRVARRLIRVLDRLALTRGTSTWVEKTCRHLRYIPFLERLQDSAAPPPRTSFIHVIRNGLEVVSSLYVASQHWEQAYDLETCIRRWNADVGFSASRVALPHDHFVFYEDLTHDPEASLQRLLADLSLSWEPSMLERYRETSRRLIAAGETWKGNVEQRIQPSRTSGHALTAEQRDRVTGSIRHDLYARLYERVGRSARGATLYAR